MRSLITTLSRFRSVARPESDPVGTGTIHLSLFAAITAIALSIASPPLERTAHAKGGPDGGHWVATWSASPQKAGAPAQVGGQTLRQIVHTSVGGARVRVRLSNTFGTDSLVIGAARVARAAGGASIVQGTDRALTFGGAPGIAIPAGAVVVSDPTTLDVPALGDLAISLFLPGEVSAWTEHSEAMQTNYLSPPGDFTAAVTFVGATVPSWYFLSGVEVSVAGRRPGAIVAIGDSVTVGVGSTPDTNQRWPDLLAERLASGPGTSHVSVVNAGIVGNRILHDIVGTAALSRFDRDVLVQTGAAYVIVLQGNPDFVLPGLIGNAAEIVTVEQVIQGHRQMIARAHALGLTVIGGTLFPLEGYPFQGFWTPPLEAKRQAVNQWIRTGEAYDAVIDFDMVLRDPSHPSRLRAEYDSGDHVHPNDSGYKAMADAIDLSVFRDTGRD